MWIRKPLRLGPQPVIRKPSYRWESWAWKSPAQRSVQAGAQKANSYHYNNAKDMVGFIDGHVSFIKMFWNAAKTNGIEAWHYDPPTGYDYKWSGD